MPVLHFGMTGAIQVWKSFFDSTAPSGAHPDWSTKIKGSPSMYYRQKLKTEEWPPRFMKASASKHNITMQRLKHDLSAKFSSFSTYLTNLQTRSPNLHLWMHDDWDVYDYALRLSPNRPFPYWGSILSSLCPLWGNFERWLEGDRVQ